MNGLRAALWTETRKATASRVLRAGAVLIVVGTVALCVTLVTAVAEGEEQIAVKLGPLADATGWPLLIGIATQIAAAGTLLAFGITVSWSFGREFTDGTIYGLAALPTTRTALVTAKLLVHVIWTLPVALAITGLLALGGIMLGLGPLDVADLAGLGRLFALIAMNGLIAIPAAWAATLGRGPMPGVATAVGLLVFTQVAVIVFPPAGAWFPFAAPALWALRPDAVTPAQLGLVPITAVAVGALCARAWNRLQLDR